MPVILHVFKMVQLNLLKKGNTQTYPRSSLAEQFMYCILSHWVLIVLGIDLAEQFMY